MYLGLDIGTTAAKAILVDAGQAVVARAERAYPTRHPAPGISEQDPQQWVEAVRGMLADIPATLRAAVKAIGLSGQMHSLVALGEDLTPVAPAILWNDARGAAECAALNQALPAIGSITGVVPMPSFTAAKLLWLRGHQPDVFAHLRHILLPKDYVRLWLTGELATDMSDAAGSQLLDQKARQWSAEVMAAIGLRPEQMPRLLEGTEVSGTLRPAVADETGLPPGIPVAAGGGDAGTGAVGLGCIARGQGFVTLGTGTSIVVAEETYSPRPDKILHTFAHSVPGRWYQMAAMLNGASSLAWAAQLLGEADIGAVIARVEAAYKGPSRLTFLPYLAGERTPHNDPTATGAFLGLEAGTTPLDMIQAVLEGVAFSLRDATLALESARCDFETLGFIGGGARSLFWGRMIATVIDRPLIRYEGADLGPALGAARLGMIAESGAHVAAIATPPAVQDVIEPDATLKAAYAEKHTVYAALYPALKAV